jgi:hypothetical protein
MAKKKPIRKPAEKKPKPKDAIKTAGKKQPTVKAKAKRAKVATSGLTSRVLGHVSGRTRRSQAKRDASQAKRK